MPDDNVDKIVDAQFIGQADEHEVLPELPPRRTAYKRGDRKIGLEHNDWNTIAGMVAVHATQAEIAAYFAMSPEAFHRECDRADIDWPTFVAENQYTAHITLRRAMWRKAMAGSPSMMMFFEELHEKGKKLLGTDADVEAELREFAKNNADDYPELQKYLPSGDVDAGKIAETIARTNEEGESKEGGE